MLKSQERQPTFIPLPEVESDRVRFDLVLPPFVNPNLLRVNVRGIERLLGWGGIGHLKVESEKRGTSAFVPTTVGTDGKGRAFAGATGLKTSVPDYLVETVGGGDSAFYPYFMRWLNTRLVLNPDEINQRILNDGTRWTGGIRSTEAWAYYLNQALGKGIDFAGSRFLIREGSKRERIPFAVSFGSLVTILPTSILIGNLLVSVMVPIAYMLLHLLYPTYDRLRSGINVHSSLISMYGPQLDRALVLKILSKTTPLVEALKENQGSR